MGEDLEAMSPFFMTPSLWAQATTHLFKLQKIQSWQELLLHTVDWGGCNEPLEDHPLNRNVLIRKGMLVMWEGLHVSR